jgi:chromosome segregation ATPase
MGVTSGSHVLAELDTGLAALRQDVRQMDADIGEANARIHRYSARELDLYRQLAEHRLRQLERGDIISGLDAASRNITRLLEQRQDEHESLIARIHEKEQSLDALEADRETLRREVEAAAMELDELEAEVQERLEKDAAYEAQLERAREADAVAERAESKTEIASEDKRVKGEPYENDKLFMYLWRRGYGTSEYSANPITRLLDRWVAGKCRYDKARPNYWMLNEIPKRLAAHAEVARAAADGEFEKLKALEADMAAETGVFDLKARVEAKEDALAELDASLADVEREIASYGVERQRYMSGTDELMTRALDQLVQELQTDGLNTLRRRAAATPTREDDRLVEEIASVEQSIDDIREEHRDRQKLYGRSTRKVRELERVRQRFKRRGYDDLRSAFANGAAVSAAVQQFLRGLLDEEDLWKIISRAHRYRQVRSRPTFGTNGFPRNRGNWKLPRTIPDNWRGPSLGRRGGFRFPSGGARRRPGGGGGFSTGGGF